MAPLVVLFAHCIHACGNTNDAPASEPDGGFRPTDANDVSVIDDDADAAGIDQLGMPDTTDRYILDGYVDAGGDAVADQRSEDARFDVADYGDGDALLESGAVDGSRTDASSDGSVDVLDDTNTDGNPCGDGAVSRGRRSVRAPGWQIECTPNKPCPAGLMCVGGGCDDVWYCMVHADGRGRHPCPTEIAPYCGCDGVTFYALHTCPDRPYERVGSCEEGVSCDPTDLLCSVPEPTCPDGYVRSVVQGRYDVCVPLETCRCEFVWECPQRDKYACDTSTNRCRALTRDL